MLDSCICLHWLCQGNYLAGNSSCIKKESTVLYILTSTHRLSRFNVMPVGDFVLAKGQTNIMWQSLQMSLHAFKSVGVYVFIVLFATCALHHLCRGCSSHSSSVPLPLPLHTLITLCRRATLSLCRPALQVQSISVMFHFICRLHMYLVFRRERLVCLAGDPHFTINQVSHLVFAAFDKCCCFPRREVGGAWQTKINKWHLQTQFWH
jgi:hypothetical protein